MAWSSDLKEITSALGGVLQSNALVYSAHRNERADWPRLRFLAASIVLTNLAKLHTAIDETRVVTNISIRPPEPMAAQYPPPETVSDSQARDVLAACREAAHMHNLLWELWLDLQREGTGMATSC